MELRSGRTTTSAAPGSPASHQGALDGGVAQQPAGPSAAPPPSASGLAPSSSDTGASQAPCGLLDLLPQDLLRKLLVERCCCFTLEEQDSRTALALTGTCRALGRLVMAAAPRRTLTIKLTPEQQQQQQWPAALESLVPALAPPDLKLVIKSLHAWQHTRLLMPPPQPLWPSLASLRLANVDMTQQELAALQLHQWPRLQELEVDYCTFVPSNPPSSHPLQPLPHLHTLRLKGDLPVEQLHIWVPLAQGPSLRVLGLHSGEHASLLLHAAGLQVTHVERGLPHAEDIRRLALLPQLQHVIFGSNHTLGSEDLSALPCPWTSMCIEQCGLQGLLSLPLGPNLQTLTIKSVWGLRDPTIVSAALGKLRQRQANLRVVVEGFGPGSAWYREWRLGRHERLVRVSLFNAELLRWVLACCLKSTVLHVHTPASSWEEALPALQESGHMHTLCLSADECKPELAAALPTCIHHVKVRGDRQELKGLAPSVAALPAHVQRLSLLCFGDKLPDLARVEAARAARQAPLVLSVVDGV